jgi:hypothetical protein
MPNNEATAHASPGTATSHSSFIESKRVSGSDKFFDALDDLERRYLIGGVELLLLCEFVQLPYFSRWRYR